MEIFVGSRPSWSDSSGQLVVNGSLYIGEPYQDPKLNPVQIFSDAALTIPLTNPVRTDAQGKPVHQVFISGAVSFRLETANGVLVEDSPYVLGIGSGDGGSAPEPLTDRNYIKVLQGNIIRNGVGSLTFESRRITSTGDFLNTGSSPKIYVGTTEVTEANGYQPGSDGFTAILAAANINEKVTLELKSTPNGTVFDSASAVDVLDGQGSENIFGVVESTNGLAFTRAPNQGAWSPAEETSLTATFFQGGASIAAATVDCLLDTSDGAITVSTDTGHADIAINVLNNGTSNPFVKFTHTSGEIAGEQLYSVQSGERGETGDPATRYQSVAPLGTALLNGLNAAGGNSLTLQIFRYDENITQVTSGTIEFYDTDNNALGYNPILGSDDIQDSALYVIKDGPTGPALDYITLVDVADGVSSNATTISINSTAGLQFVRDTSGVWLPSANFTDLVCSVFQGGATIAQETVRVTRDDSTGDLTAATEADDTNITWTAINPGTRSLTIEFTHAPSGTKQGERVISVLDGSQGAPATTGSISTLNIVRAADGTHTPASPQTVDVNWARSGNIVATREVEVSFDATGILSANQTGGSGESNTQVSNTATGEDTLTVVYQHDDSAAEARLAVVITTDGADGAAGVPVQPNGSGQLNWLRLSNGGGGTSLQPSGTVQDRTLSFLREGVVVASRTIRATLTTSSASIAITDESNTGEATSFAVSANNSSIPVVTVTHVNSGAEATYQFTYLDYDFGGGK